MCLLLYFFCTSVCKYSMPNYFTILHFPFCNLINVKRNLQANTPKPGHICRLTTPHGPQVGDLNIWARNNPREHFWASRTRQLHASHVTVGDRLWSSLPYLRPLATIVGDSFKKYGADGVGGRVHDLLGTRCDPYGKNFMSRQRPRRH